MVVGVAAPRPARDLVGRARGSRARAAQHWPLPLHLSRDVPRTSATRCARPGSWPGTATPSSTTRCISSIRTPSTRARYPRLRGRVDRLRAGGIDRLRAGGRDRPLQPLFLFAYSLASSADTCWHASSARARRRRRRRRRLRLRPLPPRTRRRPEYPLLRGLPLALFLLIRGYRQHPPWLVFAAWLVSAWQVTLSLNLALSFLYVLAILGVVIAVLGAAALAAAPPARWWRRWPAQSCAWSWTASSRGRSST